MTHKWTHKRLRASRLILLVLLLTASSVTWVETQIQPHAFAAPSLSPLIWGTNLSLFDRQDLFLTNQQTVNLAAQMHVQLVRFPYRGDLAVTTAAAKQIAAIHATPLLILPYGTDQIATDKILIQMMNTVFDTQTVYYEYGNEPDLPANGEIGASAYATSWNNVIPSLQTLTPTGKFVGPVLSKANASYVGTFLSAATPRPDAVSWHEYTCGAQDANQMCLDNITHWSTHLRETQAAMQAAIGVALPVMITEYNWNAKPADDTRATNATFLTSWMQAAITELTTDHVFAANQYVLTNNTQLALISDTTHQLTAEGQVFQRTFEQFESASMATTTTATLTGVLTPTVTTSTPMSNTTTSLLCFAQRVQTGQGKVQQLCIAVVLSTQTSTSVGTPIGRFCLPLTSQSAEGATKRTTVCLPVYAEGMLPGTPTPTPSSTPTITGTSG